MLRRLFTHQMLRPADLPATSPAMRVIGAFNPGVAQCGEETALLVRVVEQPGETRAGFLPSPRVAEDGQIVTDWLPETEQDLSDPRVMIHRTTGRLRLRFISHLRVAFSRDGRTFDRLGPAILPQGPYETFGLEDPRITPIGDTYWITAVGVSERGICTRLLSTTDFHSFKRHGNILAPDNKDVLLFPETIAGRYAMLHRPMPMMPLHPPAMWLAFGPDLTHWGEHTRLVLTGNDDSLTDRVGGSTPPIRTEQGWLTLYHGSDKKPGHEGVGTYTAGALLLDLNHPERIIARSPKPLLIPEADFETTGFVDNVVFPTAAVPRGDELWVYYGAADEHTGVTALRMDEVLESLVAS